MELLSLSPLIDFVSPFYFQREDFYKIRRIFAGKKPVMFEIEDLKGKVVDARYYRQQLWKADIGMKPKVDEIKKFITTRKRGQDSMEYA